MVTVEGKLKVGIDYAGKTHTSFKLRAAKVKDSIEATASVGTDNNLKFMLFVYSLQLLSLGDIPKESITSDLLADLYDVDLAVLQEASEGLEKKLMALNPN